MQLILGSAGVSPVVFGVPPKTFARRTNTPPRRRESPATAENRSIAVEGENAILRERPEHQRNDSADQAVERGGVHGVLVSWVVMFSERTKRPNDQLTDGGPSVASELPTGVAGPPFGAAHSQHG